MSSPRAIEFWFDFTSIYCYPAVMRIETLAKAHHRELIWRPFLLGPVLKSMGWSAPPLLIHEAKGHYTWRDIERRCAANGLAFKRPAEFPLRSLLPLRIATLGRDAAWIGGFCRRVMHAAYVEDREIHSIEAMTGVLTDMQLPASEILEQAAADANKEKLRASTEEAVARGIFGAPSFFVGEEMFWGDDRLDDAMAWKQ
jgi:2-hydroxychromene-2-carboxylate isomerase